MTRPSSRTAAHRTLALTFFGLTALTLVLPSAAETANAAEKSEAVETDQAVVTVDGAKKGANPWLARERFAVGAKFTGLTYHPDGGENEEPYPRSLDSRDFWVLQVGTQVDADYMLHKYFYLRQTTALYRDCADVWAGFFHLGFRANYDTPIGLSFRMGVGPTFLWRENWLGKVKGYKRDSFFGAAKKETFQDTFIWHGGDIEVEYKAWDHASLVYSVIPGYPEVIHNSFGARYRF